MKYCEHSTVTQAWAAILGVPARVQDEEVAAIINEARKRINDLKSDPTLVIVPKSEQEQSAYWTSQFTWNEKFHLARVGHRYLSVHVISNPKSEQRKYSKYTDVLKPQIERWLDIFRSVLRKPDKFGIDRLIFGYRNSFEFDSRDFNIGEYFNLNLGIEIGSDGAKLAKVNNNYMFFDEKTSTHKAVELEIFTASKVTDLEEYVRLFKTIRDSLAEKKLRGQRLSPFELGTVETLNQRLDELLASTVPDHHVDAMDAVREAKRLLQLRSRRR